MMTALIIESTYNDNTDHTVAKFRDLIPLLISGVVDNLTNKERDEEVGDETAHEPYKA